MPQSNRNLASRPTLTPILLRLEDAGALLGVGSGFIRNLINANEIEAVHLGAALRVVPESLLAYRERLRAAEGRPQRIPQRSTRQTTPMRGDVIPLRS